LSTIIDADRIIVLSGGRIAEEGSHRDLLEKRGEYYNLYYRDFSQSEESIPHSKDSG
jgi:ABC-type transport system involved in Fe-S cluster assembly fused permease/ATPase subunit